MPETDDIDDVSLEPEDGEGNAEKLEEKLSKLRDELAKVRKERDEYLEGWQRTKADFVNAKKRLEGERLADAAFAASGLLATLLPVLDSFEAALTHANSGESFSEGIRNTYAQLVRVLEGAGVQSFDPKGLPFDPALHEPVDVVEVDSANMDNIVTNVHQKGYTMKGKVIRPARVSVGQHGK